MATVLKNGLRKLAGACALAVAAFAHASPATVYFEAYDLFGNQEASGIVGQGNTWVNNASITASEHKTNYWIKFFIDGTNLTDVTWTFDWTLAYGGSVTSKGNGRINALSVSTDVAIGTGHTADWMGVAGSTLATDSIGKTLGSKVNLTKNVPYSIGSATDAQNQLTGQLIWDGGSTGTEVWAQLYGSTLLSGTGNMNSVFTNYGNVLASAEVTVAQPLFPDNFPTGDGTGGGQAPEPASLGLLVAGGLLAGWRRRRDRLKRLPA